jgi:predicted AAA+ superfamily ATPase
VIERDLPALGLNVSLPAMQRFWAMLAHFHGQVWNAADPARSLGVNESTVRRYLDHLTQAYLVRQLQPWHANLGKRQVKAPKIYLRDSGLLHELLGIADTHRAAAAPKAAARRGKVLRHRPGACAWPRPTRRTSGPPTPVQNWTC